VFLGSYRGPVPTPPSELPPDLPRLRILRQYLALQLQRVDDAIHAAETGTEPWLSGPAPGWCLQALPTGVGRAPRVTVHRTDCWAAEGDVVSRDEAVAALGRAGGQACTVCHPERELAGG
jgi:hypothetical protein